jgi:hypothetical protein
MKRCERCVLPDTVPGVEFDANGVCPVCRGYQPCEPLGETAFFEILAGSKRNGQWDCVVPVTGGRDSTFVLYCAKAVYGLKPLAVHFDNEFRHPQAVINIERACRKLGVELVTVRSAENSCTRVVRANVRLAMTRSVAEIARSFCRGCVCGYHAAVYRETTRRDIPMIVWGKSQIETIDAVRDGALNGMVLSKWSKLLNPRFHASEFQFLRHRREWTMAGHSLWSRQNPVLKNPTIREISLFDYVPWDRRRIKATITKEAGWEKPADHVSTWRTDCVLHGVMNYFYVKTVGCTLDCMGYSNMIAAGQMTRAEALAQEEQAVQARWEPVAKVFEERIGLSCSEIERIRGMLRRDTSKSNTRERIA